MKYEYTVVIPDWVFDHVNERLAIPDFSSMTENELDELEIENDWNEGIFAVTFEDGSVFTYDLCSGGSNYYDNMVFIDPDGYEYALDCDYELSDRIEFDIDGNTYVIHIYLEG